MSRVALLQQQASTHVHSPSLLPVNDPWQWWTPQQIADITACHVANVMSDWPLVYTGLEASGVADYDTCRVALATVAIETAHTFKPVTEAYWLDDTWRWANLRYAPYWGRGYIQLTWKDNYQYYGWRIGHPELVDFPDKALVSEIAAQVMGVYFHEHGVSLAAQQQNWAEARRLVQGGDAGLDELIQVIDALGAAHRVAPMLLSEVLKRGYSRVGDPYVWDGETPGSFDCSGFVSWVYSGLVPSFTDDIYNVTQDNSYPSAGDPVLYEYYDPQQPNTRFPHVGLWLNNDTVLDARFGYGVGVHPHIKGANMVVRRVGGVKVDTTGVR